MNNPETRATLAWTTQRLRQHWTEDNPETLATLDRRQSRNSGNIEQRTIQRLGQHWTEDTE